MAQIDEYLKNAHERGASDLHLSPGAPPMARVNGAIVPLSADKLSRDGLQLTLFEIADAAVRARFDETREALFAYELPNVVRVRCAIYEQSRGVGGAFRLLPAGIPSLEEAGLPTSAGDLVLRPVGLVIVCGPAGSGRSTTLAALVDHVNRSLCCHVVTLEEPIEFRHPCRSALVDQREIGHHTASLADGLRAALQGDADVVVSAEPRDPASLETLLDAAGGRLVLTTLTASTAVHALDVMLDRFPPERRARAAGQLAGALVAVLRQRLLPRRDRAGRVLALETLVNTPAAAALVREQRMADLEVLLRAGGPGMRPMEDAIRELRAAGRAAGEDASSLRPIPSASGAEDDRELRQAA